jgi:hypothetical protein
VKKGSRWDFNVDYRERRPWPKGMRFRDARTERIIDRRRPPKLAAQAYGSAAGTCVGARFAEAAVESGAYLV